MTPSPGEQSTGAKLTRPHTLALLLCAAVLLWLWNTRFPPVREYRLFLSEDRRSADLAWDLVSESWSEAEVRSRFTGYPIRCDANYTNAPKITRICAVDLKSLNGVPTMYVNFLFAGDKLQRVATAAPLWSHAKGLSTLRATYGNPLITQDYARSGIRLHGWKLRDGGAIFYNRDRELNPLEFNSTQWLGPSACAPRPCIQ
jgi:hypothetical protein